jgi:hypothetical protein
VNNFFLAWKATLQDLAVSAGFSWISMLIHWMIFFSETDVRDSLVLIPWKLISEKDKTTNQADALIHNTIVMADASCLKSFIPQRVAHILSYKLAVMLDRIPAKELEFIEHFV